jgi:uncharacterized membrane protein YkoI
MTRKLITIPALLMAAGIATAGGLAIAKNSTGDNDATADLAKARVTLVQAVGAAEAQVGGVATKAELESERGAVVYDVEVVTPDRKVFDVKVDAVDGKVLASQIDPADRGDHDD